MIDEDKYNQEDAEEPKKQPEVKENLDLISDNLSAYLDLLGVKEVSPIDHQLLVIQFQQQGVRYDRNHFHADMQIGIEDYSANYEAIKLTVQQGYFSISINIINIDQHSPIMSLEVTSSGSFGGISKYEFDNQTIAIKSIRIAEGKLGKIFQEAIKEYFLLVLASALKIGPKVKPIFGFDLIIASYSICFCMQFCVIGRVSQEISNLAEKLYLLHQLQIVHLDIKPENIGYSQSHGNVFIDYGLSRVLPQTIGFKSISGYSGSLNYCSPQMLELFQRKVQGSIDLYYNDAISLSKSYKHLQKQETLQYELDFANQNFRQKKTNSQIQSFRLLLLGKLTLFELSSTGQPSRDIFSQNPIIAKIYKEELITFASLLPQTLQLIDFYKKLRRMDGNIKNVRMGRNQEIDIPFLFIQIFNTIQRFSQSGNIHFKNQLQADILLNTKGVNSVKPSIYKLALIRFIKINSNNKNFARKMEACMLYLPLIGKEDLTGEQAYKETVSSILTTSLNCNQPQNSEIILQAIPTCIILQIIPDNKLIELCRTLFKLDFSFSSKNMIFLELCSNLQFIENKFKSSYNHKDLSDQVIKIFSDYVTYVKGSIDIQQTFLLDRMISVILRKQRPDYSPHFSTTKQISLEAINDNLKPQLKHLGQMISHYKFYIELCQQMEVQHSCQTKNIQLLFTILNKQDHYCESFTYLHFALFKFGSRTNQIFYSAYLYRAFYKQMIYFKEYRYFGLHLFQLIKDSMPKVLPTCQTLKMKQDIEEIEYLLKCAAQNQLAFHTCIGYLITIFTNFNLTSYPLLCDLIVQNPRKIAKLSFNLTKYREQVHYKSLNYQIFVISYIFEFMATYKLQYKPYSQILADFLQQCETALSQITCLKCKIKSLLGVKQIYCSYLHNTSLKQQSFLCSLDLMTLYIKHKELLPNAYNIILPLIRKWWVFGFQSQYNLFDFVYEFTINNNFHLFTLAGVKECNIFLHMYGYIASYRSNLEMIAFILHVARGLTMGKSQHFVDSFYKSINRLVQISFENNDSDSFKQYHDLIVNELLLLNSLSEECSFIAIYYSGLLGLNIKSGVEVKMLLRISFLLSELDNYSKKLIIRNYYGHFAAYADVCERKKRFALKKHLKISPSIFKMNYIVKVKLNGKTKSKCKFKLFMRLIKNYHQNAGNIAQNKRSRLC